MLGSTEPMTMETPLLLGGGVARRSSGYLPHSDWDVDEADYPEVKTWRDAWTVSKKESVKLGAIAGPIAFNILCIYGVNSTTQIFVGHLGNLELSAVAVALSVINNFVFGFMLGMGSALETLCGQAFGAGQVHMLGVYMQRSWIILLASAVVLSPIFLFASPILRLIGQDPAIADTAGRFTALIIPQLFAMALNFPAQKFLQAQSKVGVLAWIGFLALPVHVLLLFLFINVAGWGLDGAAVAFDLSSLGIAVAQIVYIVGWCKDGWRGLSSAAFKEIWAFVRLSLESAVMLALEVWYMMVVIVLTGDLDNAEIAVGSLSICMNVSGWEAMVFIGINMAVSVRVSNELGKGHHRATKCAVIVAVSLALLLGIFFMALILLTRDHFAVIFTSDKQLQRAVSRIAYLLGLTMLLNSVQPTISGVAIGGGWQALVAYINLGCYYLFGLPLGFLLGNYFKLGVEGIWSGMLCGTLAQTLILVAVIWKTNWKEEAASASERVRKWGGHGGEETNGVNKLENA